MKLKWYLSLFIVAIVPSSAMAQVSIGPEFGSLAASPNAIVFTNNATAGDFIFLDVESNFGATFTEVALEGTGAIGYIDGANWLLGISGSAPTGAGDVVVLNLETASYGEALANLTDVRDLAIIQQNGLFDALVADRANDTVHLISDILGSPNTIDITPSSIAGNVGIQGLIALDNTLYFLYDESPEGGFGEDELIIVEGLTSESQTTRVSWNDIGSAGAGLNTDELSVDFHNGLAIRQPDENTIIVYLSNFGAFSENQIIEVTWTNSGSGFDFSSPTSAILFKEGNLFDAIDENNGDADVPTGLLNARGVTVMPGATAADDRLVIWVDDSETNDTYMVIYDFASESFSLFGNNTLEIVLENSHVENWSIQDYLTPIK